MHKVTIETVKYESGATGVLGSKSQSTRVLFLINNLVVFIEHTENIFTTDTFKELYEIYFKVKSCKLKINFWGLQILINFKYFSLEFRLSNLNR